MAVFQRHGEWYVDYYANGRRKREKVGPSKKLAQDVLRKRQVQVAENKFLDIRKEEKVKFRDFAQTFLETHSKPNKRSWITDVCLLKHLTSQFGDKFLFEIDPVMVEKYKIERKRVASDATVNRELSCLRCLFNRAIDWGMAKENPVAKVKFFRENNKRLRYLEKEEIAKLLDACAPYLQSIVQLALNTGMRKGELQNLQWSDVNFKEGFIVLRETKNGEQRVIPMNGVAREALYSVAKKPESPYILSGKNGKPFNFRKAFDTAMMRAGISGFRFHDLRHTFASHLVMSGVDLNTVRELLGHKSLNMTLRYAHLSPDHKSRAVQLLGHKMDTIWTPSDIKGKRHEMGSNITPLAQVS